VVAADRAGARTRANARRERTNRRHPGLSGWEEWRERVKKEPDDRGQAQSADGRGDGTPSESQPEEGEMRGKSVAGGPEAKKRAGTGKTGASDDEGEDHVDRVRFGSSAGWVRMWLVLDLTDRR
jgi:hypothetical protein